MSEPTLVILAAGMASRYGSMKQTQSFGPAGETIMDYSIYDAIQAGFTKVVFIIREDFAEKFKAIFEPKLKGKIETAYVYQQLTSFTSGYPFNPERSKPWGTAHAVLCTKNAVDGPFAVINADDFYGKDAYIKAYDFLKNRCNDRRFAVIGYQLENTLSEHGSVSRGVLSVNEQNEMTGIDERLKIYYKNDQIVFEENKEEYVLPEGTKVSMNFFCFSPAYLQLCDSEFKIFIQEYGQELKSEFLVPKIADLFIKSGQGVIDVIPTTSKWFGVTYKEDAPIVQESLNKLIADKMYPTNLWA
ncbi:MAG: nucleotidyltransferase [Bacteroidetes bacterium]|nr:nucleotidyltransferase [Bacteroidota bacterium]